MTDIERIKDKVAKLMALANNEGAADNEAETALRQAEKLMRKHGIDLAEIAERTGQKPIYKWTSDLCPVGWPKPVKGQPLWFGWIGSGIGKFTDTRVSWIITADKGACIKFMGDELDVEYALWLAHHIRDQVRIQANTYDAPGHDSDTRWANREEFRHAMARRICDRMAKLRAERTEAFKATGTALMVVEDKIKQRDVQFGVQVYSKRKASHTRGSAEAHLAGRTAGDKVQIHLPVEGQKQGKLT